ncbi:MAG: DMT family transporter [bacterium]|nr:DMT family transporter [bacterium]
MGLIFAFAALIFWVIGDFNIQKATRVVGDWKSLFYIGLVGLIGIFPFVQNQVVGIFKTKEFLLLLILVSVVTLASSLFLLEGLKRGKLSVMEPVFGMELPFTVGFSIFLGGEHLDPLTYVLIAVVFIGLILVVTRSHQDLHFHKTLLEKGVIYAAIGSIGMGLTNYLTGLGAQTISPLATMWFVNLFLASTCFIYLSIKGEFTPIADLKKSGGIIFNESIFDNLAWVSYAVSMTLIPISIATTISESYIVGSVLLGVFLNKEKIQRHQVFGIVFAIAGILILSYLTR